MASQYHHALMQYPGKQIRLLRFLPGPVEEDIHVELHVFDLEECPPYMPISYTWGDKLPEVRTTVNGVVSQVRTNCWYSLWQMRRYDANGTFWIDSICIDQSNIEEKNAQVAIMGRIYSKGISTACCLGSGYNLAAARRLLKAPTQNDTSRTLLAERNAVRELQHRPYFRRIWIKQEIILSKQIRLFCGVDHLDWNTYEKVLHSFVAHDVRRLGTTLEQHPKSRGLGNNAQTSLMEARNFRHRTGSNLRRLSPISSSDETPWSALWSLLEQHGDAECSDPRDKVYALLSLLPEDLREKLDLEVDYELPPLDLCIRLCEEYMQELSTVTHTIDTELGETMINLVQHWLSLDLSDDRVSNFAARWIRDPSAFRVDSFDHLDPRFLPVEIWGRWRIAGSVEDMLVTQYSDVNEDGTLPMCITRAMPAREVRQYLKDAGLNFSLSEQEWWGLPDRPHEPQSPGVGNEWNFSALPPDLQLKILINPARLEPNGADFPSYLFLVSADTKFGDELIVGVLRFRNARVISPVFRPLRDGHGNDQSESAPKMEDTHQYALTGWALRLINGGELLTSPLAAEDDPHGFLRGWRQQDDHLRLRVYYQDLILEAILQQSDVATYLTHPRTHPDRLSYLEVPAEREQVTNRNKGKGKAKKKVGFAS